MSCRPPRVPVAWLFVLLAGGLRVPPAAGWVGGDVERPSTHGLGSGVAHLTLVSGSCTLSSGGTCVRSYNYPKKYNNDERCEIRVSDVALLTATAFLTEADYDYVKVLPSSTKYSDSSFPSNGVAVDSSSAITWYSDRSNVRTGWELCLVPPPPPPPQEWFKGAHGQSCTTVCAATGKPCAASYGLAKAAAVNNVGTEVGITCSSKSSSPNPSAPEYSLLSSGLCHFQATTTGVNCDAVPAFGYARFCPCVAAEWHYDTAGGNSCDAFCASKGLECFPGDGIHKSTVASAKAAQDMRRVAQELEVTGSCSSYDSSSAAYAPYNHLTNCYYQSNAGPVNCAARPSSSFHRFCQCKADPCKANPCGTHGTCTASGGSHSCTCTRGWKSVEGTCRAKCAKAAPAPHVEECDASYYGGATCNVSCAAGYQGSGTTTYTCGEDGRWTGGSPQCTGVQCESSEPVPHGTVCSKQVYTGTCKVECKPGYTQHNSGDTFTCGESGRWEGGGMECTEIPDYCPAAPDEPHIEVPAEQPCERHIGAVCVAQCKQPFTHVGGDAAYKCVANLPQGGGIWAAIGQSLKCERRCTITPDDCPVDHSHFYAGCNQSLGSRCKAQCDEGYTSSGSTEYTCSKLQIGNTKQVVDWQAVDSGLKCTLAGCAESRPAQNSEPCKSAEVNAVCPATCLPGYTGRGSAAYTCTPGAAGKHATWEGGALNCTKKQQWCIDNPPGNNTRIVESCKSREVGSTCNVECLPGSGVVRGISTHYECQPDRSWSPGVVEDPLVCEKMCTEERPTEHASIQPPCDFNPRSQCHAECEHGYVRIAGSGEYICGQSDDKSTGVWKSTGAGSLLCIKPCGPGKARTPNFTGTNATGYCRDCEEGKFSSGGLECNDCAEHDINQTRCLRCPPGLGPNPETVGSPANTRCEVCADRQLVSIDGVCHPRDPSLSKKIQDLWTASSGSEKGLEVAVVALFVIVVLFCGCRAIGKQGSLIHVTDLIVATVALVLLGVAIESSNNWDDILCSVATAASVLPVPLITRRYQATLADLRDPLLPDDRTYIGPIGLILFIYGLVDLVIDLVFTYSLYNTSQHRVLAGCATATMIVTVLLTWYLGWFTLRSVVAYDQRPDQPAKKWFSANPILGPAIVLASSSRLNSMSVLRLRLCNTIVIDWPDDDAHRYFHFLRNAGMFHYFVEDIPHALVSFVVLRSEDIAELETDIRFYGQLVATHETMAKLSLAISLGSIVIGMISSSLQMMTLTITATGDRVSGDDHLSAPISSDGVRPSVAQALFDSNGSIRSEIRALLNRSGAHNPLASSIAPESRLGSTQEVESIEAAAAAIGEGMHVEFMTSQNQWVVGEVYEVENGIWTCKHEHNGMIGYMEVDDPDKIRPVVQHNAVELKGLE